MYISHKYQVEPHSSLWFPAAQAAAIAYRNHFFHQYQHKKSSAARVKFTQARNCSKRVLEAVKLAYANLANMTFCKLLLVWSTKPNLIYLLYLMDLNCCNSNLDDSNISLLVFPSRTISLGEPRRVLILFDWQGHPKKSAQIIFVQHF